jgi:hypothetical protein
MKDPIVEEIREIRRQHQERCNDSWDEILKDLKNLEKSSERKVVSLEPKKVSGKKSTG